MLIALDLSNFGIFCMFLKFRDNIDFVYASGWFNCSYIVVTTYFVSCNLIIVQVDYMANSI